MTRAEIRTLQRLLLALGHDPGDVDGLWGPRTRAALTAAEREYRTPSPAPVPAQPSPALPRFPAVTRQAVTATFGPAGGPAATRGRCQLPFPFPLAWDTGSRISSFACHEKLAGVMTAVFAEAARHYGESEFRRLRLDQFGGCFNHRPVRGGTTLSIHSWGAAVDTDPINNGLHTPTSRAWLARPEYEPWWRIVEVTGARPLGRRINRDWMHWSYVQE